MNDTWGEAFFHFVWATKRRDPCISSVLEPEMYGVIISQARLLGCETLAIGGMSDHVHWLTRYGRNITLGRLLNQVKGVSSAFMNDHLETIGHSFRWQSGYGYFTVGPKQIPRVLNYVVNQKEHHANDVLYPDCEYCAEDSAVE
jgi:putative transposase